MHPLLTMGLALYALGLANQHVRHKVMGESPAPQWLMVLLLCSRKTLELGGAAFQLAGLHTLLVYGLIRLLGLSDRFMVIPLLVGYVCILGAIEVVRVRSTKERSKSKPRTRKRRRSSHRSRK